MNLCRNLRFGARKVYGTFTLLDAGSDFSASKSCQFSDEPEKQIPQDVPHDKYNADSKTHAPY